MSTAGEALSVGTRSCADEEAELVLCSVISYKTVENRSAVWRSRDPHLQTHLPPLAVASIMPSQQFLYDPTAFWVLAGAQQVVSAAAAWRVVSTLRTGSAVALLFYSLVLAFSIMRTLFFLTVALDYPLEVFELVDVVSLSLYVAALSVLCWLWWDVFLQFSGPQGERRRPFNTAFFLGANSTAVLWNFACIVVLFLLGFRGLLNH